MKRKNREIYLERYEQLLPSKGWRGACRIIAQRYNLTWHSVYQAVLQARKERKLSQNNHLEKGETQ